MVVPFWCPFCSHQIMNPLKAMVKTWDLVLKVLGSHWRLVSREGM